jgi:hypothetical protein
MTAIDGELLVRIDGGIAHVTLEPAAGTQCADLWHV